VILRILAQESPDLELRLNQYGQEVWREKCKFGGVLEGIFGNIECWEGFCVKR
jgi:hypothetical protein